MERCLLVLKFSQYPFLNHRSLKSGHVKTTKFDFSHMLIRYFQIRNFSHYEKRTVI